jgi:hypothetical protein
MNALPMLMVLRRIHTLVPLTGWRLSPTSGLLGVELHTLAEGRDGHSRWTSGLA